MRASNDDNYSSRIRSSNPLSKQSSDTNSNCSSVFNRHSGSMSRSSSTESLLDDVSIKAKTMFSMLDCTGRGYLELDNLASCCSELSQDEITDLFNELDMDGDGKISIKDFKENFRSISKTLANKDRERRMSRLNSMTDSMIQSGIMTSSMSEKSNRTRFMSVDEGTEDDNLKRKTIPPEVGEKFSALSCQEQVIDLYQYISIECPHLADSFEGIITDVIRDHHVYKTEIAKLDQLLMREKENHEKQIFSMEEELEAQVKSVDEKARQEERNRLESCYSQQLYTKTQQIRALEENLKNLHEHIEREQSNLQAAADSGTASLRQELKNLEQENRQLRNEITEWETKYALLRSDMLRLRDSHQTQKREMHWDQTTLSEFTQEKEHLSKQLSLLHQANKELTDTNESLRIAMEGHASQPGRLNSLIVGGSYHPPPVQKITLQRPVSQTNERVTKSVENLFCEEQPRLYQSREAVMGAAVMRIDSCDIDSPVGDLDSGRSTLKDVAELESEMEDPSTLRKNARLRQMYAPLSSYQRSHLINPSEVDTAKESELETETERSPMLHQRSIASRPKTLPLPTTAERCSDSDSSKTSQAKRRSPHRRLIRTKNKSGVAPVRRIVSTSRSGSIQSVAEIPPTVKTDIEPPPGSQPESWYRIVMAGDAAVGKTSYIMRLCKNKFATSTQTTLGVDYHTKTLYLDGRIYGLQLWDTAGQERFRAMTRNFFRRADGVLLMYDCSYERSFVNVRHWIDTIQDEADRNIPIMLVGNKTDLRDKMELEGKKCVSTLDGQRLAQEYEALFIETSVKDGDNTDECVIELTRLLKSTEDMVVQASAHVNLLNSQKKQESTCCSRF